MPSEYRQFHCPEDIQEDTAESIETGFDTSNYELERLLQKGEIKVIGLMKHELGGKIMKEFVDLRVKTYSYIIYDGSESKKSKVRKNVS